MMNKDWLDFTTGAGVVVGWRSVSEIVDSMCWLFNLINVVLVVGRCLWLLWLLVCGIRIRVAEDSSIRRCGPRRILNRSNRCCCCWLLMIAVAVATLFPARISSRKMRKQTRTQAVVVARGRMKITKCFPYQPGKRSMQKKVASSISFQISNMPFFFLSFFFTLAKQSKWNNN